MSDVAFIGIYGGLVTAAIVVAYQLGLRHGNHSSLADEAVHDRLLARVYELETLISRAESRTVSGGGGGGGAIGVVGAGGGGGGGNGYYQLQRLDASEVLPVLDAEPEPQPEPVYEPPSPFRTKRTQ